MSQTLMEFLQGFLAPDEEIKGPVLFAKRVKISKNGDPTAAIMEEPILMELNNVYTINTNKRILFASSGIQYDVDTALSPTSTGLASGIWSEDRGARINTIISHGYTFNSVRKEKVYNLRFSSGFVVESEFPVSQSIPKLLAAILMVLGLFLLIFFWPSTGIFIGIILIIMGLFLMTYKSLLVPPKINAELRQSNNLVLVIRNVVPTSERVELVGKEEKRIIDSDYEYIFVEIEFSEAVTAQELSQLAQAMLGLGTKAEVPEF